MPRNTAFQLTSSGKEKERGLVLCTQERKEGDLQKERSDEKADVKNPAIKSPALGGAFR